MNELEFDTVNANETETVSMDDFFANIEPENTTQPAQPVQPEQPEQPEKKQKQDPVFTARVCWRVITALLNGAFIWRTGTRADSHGFNLDNDKDDFIEILASGFETGAIKQPSPTFIAVIFLLSFFAEPVYYLISFDKKNKSVNVVNESVPQTQPEPQPEVKKIRKRKPHPANCKCIVCTQARRKK